MTRQSHKTPPSFSSELLNRRQKISRRIRSWAICASAVLLAVVIFCYTMRPDFFAALTFYPAWIWLAGGICIALPAVRLHKRSFSILLVGWVTFAGLFVEEFAGISREYFPRMQSSRVNSDPNACLRVVSLNCAGGNIKAVREALQYNPDIVLLQEAPPEEQLLALARQTFGQDISVAWAPDTSVLVHGDVSAALLSLPARAIMTDAHIRLPSGYELEAISVHLMPPATAMNLFSPDCWEEHRQDRRARRQQVAQLMDHIGSISRDVPLLIGGDFNVTAGDGALRPLKSRLRDSFKDAGVGWPNTAPSHFPLWRVDQIWVNERFKVVAFHTAPSQHSDHKIVICDLER